jgi:hypothetical protein
MMLLAVAADQHPREIGRRNGLLAEVEAGERAVDEDRRRLSVEIADLPDDLVAPERSAISSLSAARRPR